MSASIRTRHSHHYAVLHEYGARAEGGGPVTALTHDPNGMVLGGTNFGGANGLGTIYSVSPMSLAVTVAMISAPRPMAGTRKT